MSDSDDDYCDVGEQDKAPTENIISEENVAKKTNGRRGKDISWSEYESYSNAEAFCSSDFKKEIKDQFTLRKAWETDSSDNEHWTMDMQIQPKKGYIPCPLQYKVSFYSSCDEVLVFTLLCIFRRSAEQTTKKC